MSCITKDMFAPFLEMLKKNVSYTDTIKVLVNMQSAAERCLRRPSLAVWKERQSEIANTKRVKCEAYKTFADKAFILESRRKEIAKRCDGPLKDCPEHKKMVSQLVRASKVMGKKVRSVPNFNKQISLPSGLVSSSFTTAGRGRARRGARAPSRRSARATARTARCPRSSP